MTKKAAVTGHTQGLGKSFYDLLSQAGYEVHGFSRRNGYDLRDYSRVTAMLEKIQGFDVFINNAKPDYAQAQILYRIARVWQSGKVISIGSGVLEKQPNWTDLSLLEYCTQKTALAHAHQVLTPLVKCDLVLLNPHHLGDETDTYVSGIIGKLL